MNPLYPYYTLSPSGSGSNKSANGVVDPSLAQFPNNSSFVHNGLSSRTSCFNEQDMDLLKEYGIDFKSKPNPGVKTTSNNYVRSEPLDPFDLPFETSVTTNTPSTWATFDWSHSYIRNLWNLKKFERLDQNKNLWDIEKLSHRNPDLFYTISSILRARLYLNRTTNQTSFSRRFVCLPSDSTMHYAEFKIKVHITSLRWVSNGDKP